MWLGVALSIRSALAVSGMHTQPGLHPSHAGPNDWMAGGVPVGMPFFAMGVVLLGRFLARNEALFLLTFAEETPSAMAVDPSRSP